MMFGLRETFDYFQCSGCGCLQISALPEDMTRYYPSEYYSFAASDVADGHSGLIGRLKGNGRRCRNRYVVFGEGTLGKLLNTVRPVRSTRTYPFSVVKSTFPPDGIRGLDVTSNARILDVGCGIGERLLSLREAGFRNLVGVDPYLRSDIRYSNGVRVLRRSIYELEGQWDVVMFHHSLEHLAEQEATIHRVARVLSSQGICLIRTPTVSSHAWEHYRENWVELDPPRHFFVHSLESMKILASRCGLRVERVAYDSTGFQFWGSEQYLRDIPLRSERSYASNQEDSIFSADSLKAFEEEARALNDECRGDRAAFYLKK